MFDRLGNLDRLRGNCLLLPNRGRLFDFARGLISSMRIKEVFHPRRLHYTLTEPAGQLVLLRSEDVPRMLASLPGAIGVTGFDYVTEARGEFEIVEELDVLRGELTLQVREESSITGVIDVPPFGRVVTQYPDATRDAFMLAGRTDVQVIEICGAAEAFVSLGMADASVDVLCTGETARANAMRSVATIVSTSAVVVRKAGSTGLSEFQRTVLQRARSAATLALSTQITSEIL